MAHRLAAIRRALRFRAHLAHQRLELAAADVLQVDALRPPRRRFVQIHRHLELAPDFGATRSASRTQSSSVTPSMGMNGTTSAAPMRGCAPWCVVRSISATAFSTERKAASATAAGGPTKVRTERLWSASDSRSSSTTSGTARMLRRWRRSWRRRALRKNSEHTPPVVAA